MSSPPLNIMVVGTGAVGAIFASRVGQSSRTRVTTVYRSNYNPVLEHGIHLDTVIWGRTNFRPHSVIQGTSQAALFGEKYDYVALATKAFSNTRHSISELLRPVVGKGTTLISIQNGLDVEKPLQDAFPQNPVLSAICYVNCIQNRPGKFSQVSQIRPHAFHVGHDTPSTSPLHHSCNKALQTLLPLSGDDTTFQHTADLPYTRWEKITFNAAWNSVCTMFNMNTKEVLVVPLAVSLINLLAQETRAVAQVRGVELPNDIGERTLEFARTAECIIPSMLQDHREGRPLEIDALCGDVAKLGDLYEIPVPTLKMVCSVLREREQGRVESPPRGFELGEVRLLEEFHVPREVALS